MVAVKTGALMAPMGGSPMGGMPMGGAPQPNNMMSPPMPVPPINQPMPIQQGTAPIPPNANRRKRFGDSLETMLAGNIRPAAPVASDQMGGMNVFTGQMMNTARPPVAQMRNGGIVRNMRRGGSSFADYAGVTKNRDIKPPTRSGPSMTHDQLMSSIRGGSSPNDDRPAPVVTAPVVPMDFGDDDDYTPTSAELNQELLDMGAPDKRFDVVPGGVDKIYGGMGNLDERDDQTSTLNAINTGIAAANRRAAGGFSDVEMVPGTGGIAAIRSRQPFPDELSLQTPFNNTPSISIPSGTSSTLAQNMITFPESPDTGMQPGPAYSPAADPSIYVSDVFEAPVDYSSYFGDLGGNQIRDDSSYFGDLGGNQIKDDSSYFGDLGLGDTSLNPPERPVGGSQGGTDTGSGSGGDDEDDEGLTFLQKLARDFKAIPGNVAYDMKMLGYAGLFGSYKNRLKNMMDNGVPKDIAKAWLDKSQATMDKMMEDQAKLSAQDGDDYKPVVGEVVDPCPEGMRLDPVAGICVPVEEGEDEGPSLDLNRTRDDEFNELDDIMKKIVKPIGESDEVRTMQAGGSVGLNRVADNFLAAMGG